MPAIRAHGALPQIRVQGRPRFINRTVAETERQLESWERAMPAIRAHGALPQVSVQGRPRLVSHTVSET